MELDWVIHKFGGTSVGNSDCMRKCIEIIKPLLSKQRIAVVVSAMGGKPKVTDLLLDSVHAAACGNDQDIHEKLQLIRDKHKSCIKDILNGSEDVTTMLLDRIDRDLKDIMDLLRAVSLMKTPHEQILELVSGYGEIWSASIIAEVLRQQGLPFVFLNARDVLFVSEDHLGTKVHWDVSEEKLRRFICDKEIEINNSEIGQLAMLQNPNIKIPHLLITGYIATSVNGIATTLKRDGSDFSASIFGKMLKAKSITIWTDVSGVYSADPRRVPDAQIIPEVSYTEAIELAYFGAKVIHPKTMAPAIMDNIPIFIRNTFEPNHPGTRIFLPFTKEASLRERSVCGFTSFDGVALLNIEGTGMIGVPGIAHRLFGALKAANISVMYIAQSSSEYSICFATKESFAESAKSSISEAFFYELKQGLISNIKIIFGCAIIAAVGESMNNTPGVSGIFFGALGEASINVLSISQGCDEKNISAVVYSKDATRALRAVHSAFWLSSLDLSIGIVGTGKVGSAVIITLLEQLSILNKQFGINIKIRGIANSRVMLLGENLTDILTNSLDLYFPPPSEPIISISDLSLKSDSSDHDTPKATFKRSRSNMSLSDIGETVVSESDLRVPVDINSFFEYITSGATPHSIIIDASSSLSIATLHASWLRQASHVVTANKRAIASNLKMYNEVYTAVQEHNKMYMSEVTIGASLPIRTTLHDMLSSGDAIHTIVGLWSVSVGVVLTEICDNGLTFTEALTKTFATGLFEDDVFADLEGTEASQKLLILARDLRIPLEIDDIEIQTLAKRRPIASWSHLTDEFLVEDEYMARRATRAKSNNCTLRYIQRIECSPAAELGLDQPIRLKATVTLEDVPLNSPYAMVKGAVYYFAFHTARYSQNPLIIQVILFSIFVFMNFY